MILTRNLMERAGFTEDMIEQIQRYYVPEGAELENLETINELLFRYGHWLYGLLPPAGLTFFDEKLGENRKCLLDLITVNNLKHMESSSVIQKEFADRQSQDFLTASQML